MVKLFESSKKSRIVFWLCTFVFCLLPFALFSQLGTWVAIYGGTNYDRGRGIAQTSDKGYIVCGPTSSYGMGNTDAYLLKIDSAGKYQWQNTFGGMNIENCFSVKQTNDSGFAICGYTNSFGLGGYDAYMVKTDSLGNLQWQKTFGGTDWDFTYWAEQTNDGGYILAGESFSYGNNSQSYLIKTNSAGDTLWTKTFGGTNEEAAYEVHQTLDSGYILAGYTKSFGAGNADFFLIKTDSSGDTLWTKKFGNTSDDFCNSVALCKDGGFLLGGSTDSSGTPKIYFMKTDSAGKLLMSYIDTPTRGGKSVSRIRETMDGQFVTLINSNVGGLGRQEIYLDKWNGVWAQWVKTFGGVDDDEGYNVEQTLDSGFVLVGYTASFGTGGSDNIFIAKTNRAGDYNNTINTYISVNEISEKNENTLIYPNPFSDNLFLKIDSIFFVKEKDFVFEISDLCGREIMRIEKNSTSYLSEPIPLEIPSEKFSPGFYLASLQSGSKKIYRKLLFVR
ncbi:MAG: T9SS type A sorting domain-containing protein [Bacteroidota bacterium]